MINASFDTTGNVLHLIELCGIYASENKTFTYRTMIFMQKYENSAQTIINYEPIKQWHA